MLLMAIVNALAFARGFIRKDASASVMRQRNNQEHEECHLKHE